MVLNSKGKALVIFSCSKNPYAVKNLQLLEIIKWNHLKGAMSVLRIPTIEK